MHNLCQITVVVWLGDKKHAETPAACFRLPSFKFCLTQRFQEKSLTRKKLDEQLNSIHNKVTMYLFVCFSKFTIMLAKKLNCILVVSLLYVSNYFHVINVRRKCKFYLQVLSASISPLLCQFLQATISRFLKFICQGKAQATFSFL